MQNADFLFDSIKKLPKPPDSSLFPAKPLSSSLTIPALQPSLLFTTNNDHPQETLPSYEELLTKYEGLLKYLKRVEQENLELKRLEKTHDFCMEEGRNSLEIENLKLNERIQYMDEVFEKEIKDLKRVLKEKEEVIEEKKRNYETLAQEMRILTENNKKLEESVKVSNHNFISISKKNSFYEKENQNLLEKLMVLDRDKKRFSLKWQQTSEKLKNDTKKTVKLKELESLLAKKTQEFHDLKEKYVNISLELRLSKDSELTYKSKIEKRLETLQDEISKNQSFGPEKPEKSESMASVEALMRENGELYKNLNDYSTALERYRLQNIELEKNIKEITIELEILRQKSEVLNQENEKLHVSYSQLLNETKLEEKSEVFEQENVEKNLDYIKKSEEYQEISSCIKDNNILRAKLDCLIWFIQENDPSKKEFIKIKGLYERLIRKYHQLEKTMKGTRNLIENSKSMNTKESTNLFNSVVSMVTKESVKKIPKMMDESFVEPKKLFEKEEKKKKQNKSFELDKESCKKHGCGEKEMKIVKKVNLTSFLRENKTNSYLFNYITKKN